MLGVLAIACIASLTLSSSPPSSPCKASKFITSFFSASDSISSMVTAGKSKEVSSELDSNSGCANTSDPSLALVARSSPKFGESIFSIMDSSAGARLTSVLSSTSSSSPSVNSLTDQPISSAFFKRAIKLS